MMGIAVTGVTAGEPALPVADGQRPAQGGRDGAGPAADIEHLPVRTVPHLDGGGVTGDPPDGLGRDVDAARR